MVFILLFVLVFLSLVLRVLNKGVFNVLRVLGLLRVKMVMLFEGEWDGMMSCFVEVDMVWMVNWYEVWEGLRRVWVNMI